TGGRARAARRASSTSEVAQHVEEHRPLLGLTYEPFVAVEPPIRRVGTRDPRGRVHRHPRSPVPAPVDRRRRRGREFFGVEREEEAAAHAAEYLVFGVALLARCLVDGFVAQVAAAIDFTAPAHDRADA